jgi:hypothetical protein
MQVGGSAGRPNHDLSTEPGAVRTVMTTRFATGLLPRRCPVCKGTLNRSGRLRRPVTFVVTYRGDRWEGVEVFHEDCLLAPEHSEITA